MPSMVKEPRTGRGHDGGAHGGNEHGDCEHDGGAHGGREHCDREHDGDAHGFRRRTSPTVAHLRLGCRMPTPPIRWDLPGRPQNRFSDVPEPAIRHTLGIGLFVRVA